MGFPEDGEAARRAAEIDGTPDDAQDVAHRFAAAGQSGVCLVCGMGARFRKHTDAVLTQGADGMWAPAEPLPITPGLDFEVYGARASGGGVRWEAYAGMRVVASGWARTRAGAFVQMAWCWVRYRVGRVLNTPSFDIYFIIYYD